MCVVITKCQFDLWYLKDLLERLLVNSREIMNYPGTSDGHLTK